MYHADDLCSLVYFIFTISKKLTWPATSMIPTWYLFTSVTSERRLGIVRYFCNYMMLQLGSDYTIPALRSLGRCNQFRGFFKNKMILTHTIVLLSLSSLDATTTTCALGVIVATGHWSNQPYLHFFDVFKSFRGDRAVRHQPNDGLVLLGCNLN